MASGNNEGRVDERDTRNAPIYIGRCHNLVVPLLSKAVASQEFSLCATSCGPVVARSKPLKHHDRRARLVGKENFAQRSTAEYLWVCASAA